MNVLDLFSGIGGFSLGLESAGMQTIAFCEIDQYCLKVLTQEWPRTWKFEDIRELSFSNGSLHYGYESFSVGSVDLVCGGYPCQPFSMAGRRGGAEDERHLWPEMLRLIRDCRPRWVVAENVYGHISLGFDEVASSLEAEGFTVWPFVVPACSIGAPHRRDRLWIIAHAKGAGKRGEARDFSQAHGRQNGKLPQFSDGATKIDAANAKGLTREQGGRRVRKNTDRSPVADTGNQRCEGRFRQALPRKPRLSRKLARGFERWANGWPVSAPRLCRVDDGIPHRVDRLRALGNSIVPQIAALIGEAIMTYENQAEEP